MKVILHLLMATIFLGVPQLIHAGGGWLIYREGPFKGRVMDAESKEPIEGAVVVAQYHVYLLTVVGLRSDMIDVQEALTNSRGEFYIPVYTTTINPLSVGDDVSFLIWKPGYKREERWGGYFFAKEPGTIENRPVQTDRGFEIKAVRLGIIELGKLGKFEERRMEKPSPIGEERYWKKQKQFIKLIRKEWEYITGEPAKDLYQVEEAK